MRRKCVTAPASSQHRGDRRRAPRRPCRPSRRCSNSPRHSCAGQQRGANLEAEAGRRRAWCAGWRASGRAPCRGVKPGDLLEAAVHERDAPVRVGEAYDRLQLLEPRWSASEALHDPRLASSPRSRCSSASRGDGRRGATTRKVSSRGRSGGAGHRVLLLRVQRLGGIVRTTSSAAIELTRKRVAPRRRARARMSWRWRRSPWSR